MKPTIEQQIFIDTVMETKPNGEPKNELVALDSCAGSGKTSTLINLVKAMNPKRGLYLAYNKAIAVESESKFPTSIKCSTTHSFAYQNTIKPYGLTVGSFFWKSIEQRMKYAQKLVLLDLMKEWCLSKFHSFEDFKDYKNKSKHNIPQEFFGYVREYFRQMCTGEIPITHDGYLKFYHMLLANKKIRHNQFELIMLDEAGDLNLVTFEIFKLLPAKHKVMVGDVAQNIYGFNHTVNCFKEVGSEVPILSMSQSFRCHSSIAKRIEKFTHEYIDKNKDFLGVDFEITEPKSIAYISRNNAILIGKMIEFNKKKIRYNILRKASVMFELVLILLGVNKNARGEGDRITKGEYKYIQQDIDKFNSDIDLQNLHNTAYKYVSSLYGEDPAFKTAFNLIREHGPKPIYAAYYDAVKHEDDPVTHAITLGTGFSTKGKEFDKVYIMDDLNMSLNKIFDKHLDEFGKIEDPLVLTEKEKSEFLLYYVACSRAKIELIGADHLPI